MAFRFFTRLPVVSTVACRAVQGTVGAANAGSMGRRGSKNFGWFYRALERQRVESEAVSPSPFPETPLHGKPRPQAYIDLTIGDEEEVHRVVVELADDVVPRTVENFIKLCTGADGLALKGTKAMKIDRQIGVFLGDVDGTGVGHSALGSRYFDDENFGGRHSEAGVVTMANSGTHTNSSVFTILVDAMPHLDGRNVAFGVVTEGMDSVKRMAGLFHVDGKPLQDVVVRDAGLLSE